MKSVRVQLLSVRSDVDQCCQRLSLYTERLTANLTDSFSGIPYNCGIEDEMLVEKQREDLETNMNADLHAINPILRSADSNISRTGPFS